MARHATNRRRIAAALASLLLLAGCSDAAPPDATGATETPAPAATPAPEKTGGVSERSGKCGPPRAAPPEEVPHYDMSMRVDTDAGTVTGHSDVTFVADRPTSRLVFRLWPNGPRLASEGTELAVEDARLRGGGGSVDRPDPTTLVFELDDPLPPGETVVAELDWTLDLPGPILDRISQDGDTIRLGSFFPILAWEGERGWATDPPTTTLAEASTSPTADFDVRIEVPQGLDVIASGRENGPGRWVAEDVRDFAVAVGRFDVTTARVDAPNPVQVTVGVAEGLGSSKDDFRDAIARALRDLSKRYGPYPWRTFSMAIVPGLGRSGIEYPTMIFQGDDSLTWATTHEVAHSWFYGLVGNNQGRDPWLDEGVTSWAQARGDGILGYFRDYEMRQAARGRLGKSMRFWDGHEGDYYDGVYVQGVKALDALGRARKVDCALRRYVARNAYEVATTDDLVEALEESFPRASRVLKRFGARL
ncbi:MAG TPA: hypothetical protein VEV43_01960 [Actinomycetota bacterium]|nr:hypothetical protein [Actinomycetota bacterium]